MPDFLIALLIILICLCLSFSLGWWDRPKKRDDDKPYKQWWGNGL